MKILTLLIHYIKITNKALKGLNGKKFAYLEHLMVDHYLCKRKKNCSINVLS